MKKIILIMAAVMTVLAGCEMELPNPVIGTYILTAESEGSAKYMLAGFSFDENGGFSYAEVVKGSDMIVKVKGRYSLDLEAFTFVNASGALVLDIDDIEWPSGVEVGSIYLGDDVNTLLFDWKCDRNNGPQGMTLVRNPYQPSENLELIYVGGPGKLEGFLN